jgi:hypothetical protein
MHPENLTAIASTAAEAAGFEQPEGEQPASESFDEGLGDRPPHAANPIASVMSPASSTTDRQP